MRLSPGSGSEQPAGPGPGGGEEEQPGLLSSSLLDSYLSKTVFLNTITD